MRRVVVAAVIATATVTLSACSSSGEDSSRSGAPSTDAQAGPLVSSQQFDRPFPVSGEDWDATVTLSGLRFVPSGPASDRVVAVDVRAVQASGEPTIGPGDITAFDPSGSPFERIENPAGTVDDPLVDTVMSAPGQEIRGTVAWTMPDGGRIGRIEVAAPQNIGSVIVTRQPDAPTSTDAAT
ncbi:MAG TPA: hypothetical protein H9759_13860 [Candidatus Dietzia intestinipullorum]|nr:hypothetical protein [Candidatus Dietzia intestinipullorum]